MELSCGNSWKFMLELKSWSGAANCNLMPHWEYMENECGCLLYTSREIVAVKPGGLAITNYEWSMLVKYIPKTFTRMSYVAGRGWGLALRRQHILIINHFMDQRSIEINFSYEKMRWKMRKTKSEMIEDPIQSIKWNFLIPTIT